MTEPIILNTNETGYLRAGEPLFDRTFLRAMSFHWPEGLAAVKDEGGAYHIDHQGRARYEARYREACGFYKGLAAVKDERGWLHIRPDGSPVHRRRFRWSGNFQGGRCAVLGHDGFFHIDARGADAYPLRHRYAGDYRYGVAVVLGEEGAYHVDRDGRRINAATFRHAEPYHKGVAVVADDEGFFHVDRTGRPLHRLRLRRAEPFYNGVSLCEAADGTLLRLRENGTWTRVAGTTAPISLAGIQDRLRAGAKVGLFVRHAERHPITPDSPDWGNGVLLTPQGVEVARDLGRYLEGPWSLGFHSSPVPRCGQTCEAIALGAGIADPRISVHTHLGDPGIYIDGTGDHEEPMKKDFHVYATGYLDGGTAPGTRPLSEASEELLSFLRAEMALYDCTVFISHDFFAAALMCYLGLKAPDRDDWCDYLEGVCILLEPDGTSYRRFAGQREVTRC